MIFVKKEKSMLLIGQASYKQLCHFVWTSIQSVLKLGKI